MNTRIITRRFRFLLLALVCSSALIVCQALIGQQPSPAPLLPADAAAQHALELFEAGKIPESIAAYEKVVHDYPTAGVVSEAQFRLGYLYFLNGNPDKSVDELKKVLAPPAPPEVQELAYSLLPQVFASKASKLPPDDPQRKAAYEDAIKQFDAFIQKYPTSDEMETVIYSRALSCYQIGKYDEAEASLRSNLEKFPRSETILDSQYLLAITYATQAVSMLQAKPGDPQGFAKFDDATKLFADMIQKPVDISLANDAQFQIGEVMLNRAAFSDKAAQPALLNQAVAAYRAVLPKELMVKAEQDRIAAMVQGIQQAAANRNVPAVKHYQRLVEHERAKMNDLKDKPDQTVTAKIKIAEVYYQQQRYDEARLMLNFLKPYAEDDTQKKDILYYTTLTYIAQDIVDKAVASYNDFKDHYKNDPMADNLPLAMGNLFVTTYPQKAVEYFKEEISMYPKGRFVTETLAQEATAMVQLKQFDEALTAFKSLLAGNPTKEIAVAADLGIATIYGQSNKPDEAIAAFKNVITKYPGTPQAEQAAFYVGQITEQMKGDHKTALTELTSFIEKYPDSKFMPTAMFFLATAELGTGDKDAALAKFKEIEDKFPQSEVGPYCYFQRASILSSEQKEGEMVAVMREFISKYPDNDRVYYAYDSVGQSQVNAKQLPEAVATYNEFVEKHPQSPQASGALLKIADLWQQFANATGLYLILNETQRVDWNKGVDGSIAAAEKLVKQYPDSHEVALALQILVKDEKLLLTAKLKSDADVQHYFQDLAAKFDSKPSTKSKVLFTLASLTYEKDKAKALEMMNSAYNPKLIYAPADLDLYGGALLDQNKIDQAQKVYEKLAADYPNPPGVTPDKAPADVAEAQSIALYGLGKCLQKQGKTQEAGEDFDKLKTLYPWSPKILEASFGIAQSLYQQKKYDDAIKLLIPIMRAQSASATVELRANAMLLGGEIQEEKGNIEAAIDYYIKIASFYEGVPEAAAEGLWRGGQLLEKQAASLPATGNVTKSGQLAKAVKAYKDLVEKYPSSQFVDKAKQRLSALAPGK